MNSDTPHYLELLTGYMSCLDSLQIRFRNELQRVRNQDMLVSNLAAINSMCLRDFKRIADLAHMREKLYRHHRKQYQDEAATLCQVLKLLANPVSRVLLACDGPRQHIRSAKLAQHKIEAGLDLFVALDLLEQDLILLPREISYASTCFASVGLVWTNLNGN